MNEDIKTIVDSLRIRIDRSSKRELETMKMVHNLYAYFDAIQQSDNLESAIVIAVAAQLEMKALVFKQVDEFEKD